MERVFHCNVCFKTFNNGLNNPDGTIEGEGNGVKLICQACRVSQRMSQTDTADDQDDLTIEEDPHQKASCGLTTVRSSKTSKSQENNQIKIQRRA